MQRLNVMLESLPLLRRVRQSVSTVWAISSLFLFIDTFIYTLTVANLPDILQSQMHVSQSSNGVITTMFGIGTVIGALASGIPSDRYSMRWQLQLLASVLYLTAGIVFYFSQHFYQLLIFRLVNGIASGIACTMLFTTVGDVFPADLLGFKVAIICLCNNIAYTIGPICGQKLFELNGIRSIASVVLALSLLEFVLLVLVGEESLTLRRAIIKRRAEPGSPPLEPAIAATLSPRSSQVSSFVEKNANNLGDDTIELSHSGRDISSTNSSSHEGSADAMPLRKIFTSLPVLVSTINIVMSVSIQCTLEAVLPLHLSDRFHRLDSGGLAFLMYGLALSFFAPPIGKLTDWSIDRYGEQMRHYIMLSGSVGSAFAVLTMALASSYAVLMVGYVFLAATNVLVNIPAQSAYGDYVNGTKVGGMALSYSISILAWAIGAIALPPVGTALYTSSGFAKPMIGIASISSAICIVACLVYPVRRLLGRQ